MNETIRYPRNSSVFARVALLTAAAALCLCGGKQPKQEQIDALGEQEKLEQQKNMPDLTITATGEDYCRVVFVTKEDKGEALCVIGSDGKGLKKKQCGFIGSALHVSPNGKKVVYQGYSNREEFADEDGRCQVVYDMERDTLEYFRLYVGRGSDPRWWDDNHIYYRSALIIVKQNVQTGKYTKVTDISNKSDRWSMKSVWHDPIWIPGLRNYIVLGKKLICFYKINGKMIRCDSLLFEAMTGTMDVFNFRGEPCVSFLIYFKEFEMGLMVQNLNGKKMLLKTKIGRCENYENGVSLSFDPAGKWIYYAHYVIVDSYSNTNDCMLRRVSVSDSTLDQLIYFNTKGLGNITCISE